MREFIENIFEKSQIEYLVSKDKDFLKKKSQFFTPYDTAIKMISTIDFNLFKKTDTLSILEPSAGCGILVATLVESIIKNCKDIKNISICTYEQDENVCNILKNNLLELQKLIIKNTNVSISFETLSRNFILDNSSNWIKDNNNKYDIIISNPPYKKINQSSDEALVMKDLIYGQPNIYTLFIAMSLSLLKANGVYTVLSPRNYLNGIYSQKLRNYIFKNNSLTHLHSFEKRTMFKSVNQEVIISTYKKTTSENSVNISFNGHNRFTTNINDIMLDNDSKTIIIPREEKDIKLLESFSKLENSLSDLFLKISVGAIVQFRNTEDIREEIYNENFSPLLIGKDIQSNNKIDYFNRENNLSRKTHKKSISKDNGLLIKNSNYLIIRKVTAKDDLELIVSSVLNKNYFNHNLLGIDNNLLYIHKKDYSELTLEECHGLYCFINSKQFKVFYLLINGTHTINVSDFNNIKFPDMLTLKKIGEIILEKNDFSENTCSTLINEYLNIKY
ncbi:TPA: Eco57I restriction-modification methylase domain-containing protein [Clostridioides difficile]|uniref:Eco57I restriction-modification methylase domain-containing protein n=3 Tax=Clostridioides difficile TaxID=1496 RepID=UPI00097FED8D|nr:Eco57I restriction-modification methylase domain-containing protein [Clostridioides difficile]MDI3116197.1 Eco57I restriction-modification methylase domain-containing protein [Clostridioides difficile]SJP47904.1 Type I restriction-modification system methyltransferase subunit [Clostridioides difficile]HBG4072461.1 Eco57I restriction-modification methylase domain-containing protein [Clostridioides difficile]